MDIKETHNKIISILRIRGPSLPIQIAKELKMSSLFVSAFLSELYDEKRIRISQLKVGGSPLYFLEGQEARLENYYKFMHPKESETFLLLKDNRVLRDSEQEPAIRVALRSIKDFAIGFKFDNEIYWRYFLFSELEAVNLVKSFMPIEVKKEIKKKELEVGKDASKLSKDVSKDISKVSKESDKEIVKLDKEIVKLPINKKSLIKTKSDFVLKVVNFIKSNNLNIIEERSYKLKEYNCILQIKSELGNINFLTQAKDKKIITDSDLKKLLNSAQSSGIPAFILYMGELSKKAREFLIKYKSILKAKRIE